MDADVYVQRVTTQAAIPADALPALSTPQFIIRDGMDYWIPVAMLKYRLDEAVGSAVEDGCNHVSDLFEQLISTGNVVIAVKDDIMRATAAIDQASDPGPR